MRKYAHIYFKVHTFCTFNLVTLFHGFCGIYIYNDRENRAVNQIKECDVQTNKIDTLVIVCEVEEEMLALSVSELANKYFLNRCFAVTEH